MDDSHELDEADAVGDGAHDTLAAAKLQKPADRHVQRLDDLLANALEESDPLRGNVRAAAAELLAMAHCLAVSIKAVMGPEASRLKTYSSLVMPAIDRMAVMHRQATRYLQLDRDRAPGDGSGQRGILR